MCIRHRLRVLRDAARALHYLHTLSPMILHRDVSAGNILLDERGNGYLADVGLARAAEATAGSSQQVSHLSTQRIFGKPGYMDPIIMQNGQASVLTDGYALGITLLVSLTGRGALGLLNACDYALDERPTRRRASRRPTRAGRRRRPMSWCGLWSGWRTSGRRSGCRSQWRCRGWRR